MDLSRALPLPPCMVDFAKVMETGSFTAAARPLDATPLAVSRQVARLERGSWGMATAAHHPPTAPE